MECAKERQGFAADPRIVSAWGCSFQPANESIGSSGGTSSDSNSNSTSTSNSTSNSTSTSPTPATRDAQGVWRCTCTGSDGDGDRDGEDRGGVLSFPLVAVLLLTCVGCVVVGAVRCRHLRWGAETEQVVLNEGIALSTVGFIGDPLTGLEPDQDHTVPNEDEEDYQLFLTAVQPAPHNSGQRDATVPELIGGAADVFAVQAAVASHYSVEGAGGVSNPTYSHGNIQAARGVMMSHSGFPAQRARQTAYLDDVPLPSIPSIPSPNVHGSAQGSDAATVIAVHGSAQGSDAATVIAETAFRAESGHQHNAEQSDVTTKPTREVVDYDQAMEEGPTGTHYDVATDEDLGSNVQGSMPVYAVATEDGSTDIYTDAGAPQQAVYFEASATPILLEASATPIHTDHSPDGNGSSTEAPVLGAYGAMGSPYDIASASAMGLATHPVTTPHTYTYTNDAADPSHPSHRHSHAAGTGDEERNARPYSSVPAPVHVYAADVSAQGEDFTPALANSSDALSETVNGKLRVV